MEEKVEVAAKTTDSDELDERFQDDPGAQLRIYSVLSYFFVLVVLGLPIWWYTTRVYRAALPMNEMTNVDIPAKTVRENSIPLSLEYDVLITIANPDPENLKVDINARDLVINLAPFISTLDAVANITVKSQWLYLVDLGVAPKWQDGHLALHEEQLPHIITPLEKKIWSHISQRPCLNLVVYIGHCNSPLYIYDKNRHRVPSNAFLSPRWGGITVLNADSQSCVKKTYRPDLRPVLNTFLIQLRELLGLRGDSAEDVVALKRTKAKEMVESTRRTLKSLAQLLSEINSIVISDEVAEKVKVALESADEADRFLADGDIDGALAAAKVSYKNSEEAFSDPSLLALLYFPDDQKYAVYIPLFLPIMIPVLMSLMSVWKFYKNKRRMKVKNE